MLIEPDNIMFNKASIIERSLNRVIEEYNFDPTLKNFTHIDALILNIERACQAAIDMASHIVAKEHLGIPQSSADSFKLLVKKSIISQNVMESMVGMTGFRNIAIHEYQEINLDIVRIIVEKEYKTLVQFCKEIGIKIIIK